MAFIRFYRQTKAQIQYGLRHTFNVKDVEDVEDVVYTNRHLIDICRPPAQSHIHSNVEDFVSAHRRSSSTSFKIRFKIFWDTQKLQKHVTAPERYMCGFKISSSSCTLFKSKISQDLIQFWITLKIESQIRSFHLWMILRMSMTIKTYSVALPTLRSSHK